MINFLLNLCVFLIIGIPFFMIGLSIGWAQGWIAHRKIIDTVFSDETALSETVKEKMRQREEESGCKNS